MSLEIFPNTGIDRQELSTRAQVLLWEKPPETVGNFRDAITERTLREYITAEPDGTRSTADVTALVVLRSFKLRERRTRAEQLAIGIENAFTLLKEASPIVQRPQIELGNDGYETLEGIPTL